MRPMPCLSLAHAVYVYYCTGIYGGFYMISKDESTTTKYYGASQYNKERTNHSQFNDGAGLFWPADAFSHTNKKTSGQDAARNR